MRVNDFSFDELLQMAKEVCNYNGSYDEIAYVYESLEELIEATDLSAVEAVRAVFFGDVNYWDNGYYKLNVYGNIGNISDDEFRTAVENQREEIVRDYVELVTEGNIRDYYDYVDDELLEELGLSKEEEEDE